MFFILPVLLLLAACAGSKAKDEAKAADETEGVQIDTIGLHGEWRLESYRIDSASTDFGADSPYKLSIDEPGNAFGLSTDCNTIGGAFSVTDDTIRFENVIVTEMACHEMKVEEAMLRLINDSCAYALCVGDTIRYTAPSLGGAVFVRAAN